MIKGLLTEVGGYELSFQANDLEQLTLKEFEGKVVSSQKRNNLEEVYECGEMSNCDIGRYVMKNGDGRYELNLAISIGKSDDKNEIQEGIEFYVLEHNAGYHFLDFLPGYDWGSINSKVKEILMKESLTQQIYGPRK